MLSLSKDFLAVYSASALGKPPPAIRSLLNSLSPSGGRGNGVYASPLIFEVCFIVLSWDNIKVSPQIRFSKENIIKLLASVHSTHQWGHAQREGWLRPRIMNGIE